MLLRFCYIMYGIQLHYWNFIVILQESHFIMLTSITLTEVNYNTSMELCYISCINRITLHYQKSFILSAVCYTAAIPLDYINGMLLCYQNPITLPEFCYITLPGFNCYITGISLRLPEF